MKSDNRLEKNPAGDKENIAHLLARGRAIPIGARPLIMGILNINDGPFSGEGRLDPGRALERALELVASGADVVDVGGGSARANRAPVSEEEEWGRVAPFLEKFPALVEAARPREGGQVFPPLLSVNTRRTGVAARALQAGCDLLNDMGALPDIARARLCAERGTALLITRSKGGPKAPHAHVKCQDIMDGLEGFLETKIALACEGGLSRESLVLDPGIDFSKQTGDSLRILRELPRLARFGCPILLSVSRKGAVGSVTEMKNPAGLDAGTVACIVAGALRGAAIFRVHNIHAAWLALRATLLVK